MARATSPCWVSVYFWNPIKQTIRRTGIAAFVVAVIGSVVGSYVSYQDRIDTSQNTAWGTLRAALEWSERGKWGNVGQIQAIETLTRDCDRWWFNTPLKYILGRNCVELKSLSLMLMDLGGLKADGATFNYSFLACSNLAGARLRNAKLEEVQFMAANLAGARLRNAKLEEVQFMAANLAGADFSGAHLSKACLFLADVSGAVFDGKTTIDNPENLLKASVHLDDKGNRQNIKASGNDEINAKSRLIPLCPGNDRCPLLAKDNGWNCGVPQ